jgi:CHAT domain-containing protein
MHRWLLLCLVIVLGSCDSPPPEAYYKAATKAQGSPIGENTTGEACTLVRLNDGGDIFCGAWQQASARVRSGGPASAANLMTMATASPWRTELNGHFLCGDPKQETPESLILQCSRRSGGWAQIGLVTIVGNSVWMADGTPAAFPAMQRAIAQLSGGPNAAASTQISGDMANYLAHESYSSGDIAQYETLMTAGLAANLADRPDQAERAYRAALALQEKAQGAGSPAAAAALMSVALQLSNQGRFDEAQGFFDRAAQALRAPGAAQLDVNGLARLTLYQGLNALNRRDYKSASEDFTRATAAFKAQAPDVSDAVIAHAGQKTALSDAVASSRAYETLAQKEALLGMLEARRNLAVAQRLGGDAKAADQTSRATESFAAANGLTAPLYAARLYRTAAISAAANDELPLAISQMNQAVSAFQAAQPRTRPTAQAELARASLLARDGRKDDALAACRSAATLLRDTKDGVDFEFMQPCLGVYAAAADQAGADKQALLFEMFAAAQLTRGTVTDQEIRRTAVRMAAGGADPKISEAIRKQQDAERALGDLLHQRDALGAAPTEPDAVTQAADLDKKIKAARDAQSDADGAVQSAAPNYQQLIQQPVKSEDVFAALRPDEAFIAITMAKSEGWVFALHDHRMTVAHLDGGTARVAGLVKTLRASIEFRPDGSVPQFDVAVARQLYDLTLGGIASSLDGVTYLTIAPTGPLLSIPFETLLTGPADSADLSSAPFLVRKFVITDVPAASNFVKLRQAAASAAPRPWIGFGDFRPVTEAQAVSTYPGAQCHDSALGLAGLPLLEGTRRELDIASRIYGASPGDERTGQAFTVDEIYRLNAANTLKQYRIVHFAAHGLLPSEISCQQEPLIVTSAPAGAVNADGALLTTSKIEGLAFDADVVILSACNSAGPGGSAAGESLAGLARAFFYAGARALLVTHWDVDDAKATYLMAQTLNTLKKRPDNGLAAALRTAQLTYLGRTDIPAASKQPVFWAPFAIVGEGRAHGAAMQSAATPVAASGL